MAILIYLLGQKQAIILREKDEDFRKAIREAYKLKAEGKPAAMTEFKGWHGKPIWVKDMLVEIQYASAESDKEIQDQQNEATKQAYARKKAMERAAAQGGGPGGGRILNLSGDPGPGGRSQA